MTPVAPGSKQWRVFHHLPAAALLPFGLITVICDTAIRVLFGLLSVVWKDSRDPRRDFQAVCDDSRKWKQLNTDEVSFDSDFRFGASSSIFQSGPQSCPNSQWWGWLKKVVPAKNRSGPDANLFELMKTKAGRSQIIDRLKKLGCNSYRFNIEWCHIEPERGAFNKENFLVYLNFCQALRSANIEPVVGYHHFTEPKWFHEMGSFEKEENIKYFVNFCKKVHPYLTQNYWFKPLVGRVFTINEPGIEAFSRYVRGAFSPGYSFRFNRAGYFLKGMLKAHCAVYKALKKMNPNIQIGITHQRLKMETVNPLIRPVVHLINRLVNETILNFFKTGIFSYKIPLCSHLREEGLEPEVDWMGLQYYCRPVIGMLGSSSYFEPMTQMPFREDPEGIYEAILEVYEATKCPMDITETGISTKDSEQRKRFNGRSLYAVDKAADKIGRENVRGYLTWNFADDTEWNMGRKPQAFGAYRVLENGKIALMPKEGMEPFTRVATAATAA